MTIVVRYLSATEPEDELYYHGEVTQIEEDNSGFWCVLDDDKMREEFFYFFDLENVIDVDRILFFAGTTKRRDMK